MLNYLCTIADASYLAGVNASTIRRWITENRLNKSGRKPYKVELAEVERLRDTLKRQPHD